MCSVGGSKSFFNDYGRVCTTCGSLALFIAGVYFLIAILLRAYLNTDTLALFESVPTYIPAISYLICGLSTVACGWKACQNTTVLKLTSLLSLCNAGLSSVITIAVIFINFKSFNAMSMESCHNPETNANHCHCEIVPYSPAFPESVYILNGCLLMIVPTSIVAIFLSIFLCRLLDEIND